MNCHMDTLVARADGPAVKVGGFVVCSLRSGQLVHMLAQHSYDHGPHQHGTLRVRSVPVAGGVNVFVDTAM